jgi:hypothetical protein
MSKRYEPADELARWQERYIGCCDRFYAGYMPADVFRAHLYMLGMRGAEIESEVHLNSPEPEE